MDTYAALEGQKRESPAAERNKQPILEVLPLEPADAAQGGAGGGGRGAVDAMLVINMCHISPLEATRGMIRGAGIVLRPGGGLLFVYGPFTRGGRHTSDSNAAFDLTLRSRDPRWGYRDLEDMAAWAKEAGLEAVEVREMPANNFMLVFRRP
ncbi:hypothetical protein TSOC_009981 [Tetrabaena socialis]|uniref:DUF938 domain-containing protein n=1 Tax=Tetrabaena socialis TaxID=47790 RepID=A0A2J7ZUH6_9CHLO|nr:hypothetical protein TSOC_009981 [Tetrabaena socialis]|eukprot:PNH03898.1 hypothetical protein TSOC_009981 [Tetrabaena socialis]